jgi:hypothetical protein
VLGFSYHGYQIADVEIVFVTVHDFGVCSVVFCFDAEEAGAS